MLTTDGPPQHDRVGIPQKRRIRCIVKLGGAAITNKEQFESLNVDVLAMTARHLAKAMGDFDANLDCHKAQESRETFQLAEKSSFIVVHGAGSFGHFQASQSGVARGGLDKPAVKAGFVATRISVTKLSGEVARSLAEVGVPAVAVSPFSAGWTTASRQLDRGFNLEPVQQIVDAGFVPVLHGDAVLDSCQGCTILSGDVIVRQLAADLRPDFVVFLTNVSGVFDRPPSDPGAVLIRRIGVEKDAKWRIVEPPHLASGAGAQVETSSSAHDTTGGMVTKISEAAAIAALGTPVVIAEAGTDNAQLALEGKIAELAEWVPQPPNQESIHRKWHGTLIMPL